MKKLIYLALALISVYSCKKSNSSGSTGNGSGGTGDSSNNTPGNVSTFVGSATSSPFTWPPTGITSDSKGNIYVSEANGSIVVKITPAGTVSTFAGNGVPGCETGTGTSASFTFPYEVCSDAQDNIYVADYSCSGIKRISSAGVVSVFCAGNSTQGVSLASPQTVGSDPQGNIYVGDELGEENLAKISPQGAATLLAGDGTTGYKDGPVASAEFMGPSGMCADGNGNVYVADGHRIRKISGGQVTTIAGNQNIGFTDGTGANAQFGGAMGLCVDSKGNIYVADVYNSAIRMVTPAGVVTTVAGTGVGGYKDGDGSVAMFSQPTNLCFNTDGNLYVADYGNNVIRKIVLK